VTLYLRQERQRRGWSLTYVTRLTGIAPGDLSLIERGLRTPFPRWQAELARVFGMPARRLFRANSPSSPLTRTSKGSRHG
jgi:transcriptional regulator with XRE-family HTH domain